ncbi:hypothetical protein [Janibacter melonis]|uniref:hypothetical protein n=1 Tax=Janibacter melonis TaxID=262209 RepID=UPI0017850893|nr:hypothetical protein [Janibacter melonis]
MAERVVDADPSGGRLVRVDLSGAVLRSVDGYDMSVFTTRQPTYEVCEHQRSAVRDLDLLQARTASSDAQPTNMQKG